MVFVSTLPVFCPFTRGYPTATMTHWVYNFELSQVWSLLLLIDSSVLFYCDNYDYYWGVYVRGYSFCNTDLGLLKLGNLDFAIARLKMFQPMDLFLEYWTGHVIIGLLYVIFAFSTRIFYREFQASQVICSVWCHGLNPFLLYVGYLFGDLV